MSGAGLIEGWSCSRRPISRWWGGGTIGTATQEGSALSNDPKVHDADEELAILLEAARRANWDALQGPPHLRSGRFRPYSDQSEKAGASALGTDKGARRVVAEAEEALVAEPQDL